MLSKISILAASFFLVFSFALAQEDLGVSPGLTPKSALYFLDGVGEWISLRLTFNPVKKAEKKIQHASERLAELKAMGEAGDINKERAEKIKEKYKIISEDVSDDIDDLENKGQDVAELVRKIEAIAIRHEAVLERVLDKAPEQAKEALERALEASQKGHERAIEAILKEVREGETEMEDLEEGLRTRVEKQKEKNEVEGESRPGVEIKELNIDDDQDEVEYLTKDIDENGLKDLDGDLDLIENNTK